MNYFKLTLLLTCLLIFETVALAQGGMYYDESIGDIQLDPNKNYTLIVSAQNYYQSTTLNGDGSFCRGDTTEYSFTTEIPISGETGIDVETQITFQDYTSDPDNLGSYSSCTAYYRGFKPGDIYHRQIARFYINGRGVVTSGNRAFAYVIMMAEEIYHFAYSQWQFGFELIENPSGEVVINLPPPNPNKDNDNCESNASCSDGSSNCLSCTNDCTNNNGQPDCGRPLSEFGGGSNGGGDDDDCNVSPTIGINE